MTDLTLPSGGGSYIRQKDGSLVLDEAPTAREAEAETPIEGTVQTPVEPAFKSRRSPVADVPESDVKEA